MSAWAGRTVLVTGASRGVGRALAHALVARSANVALSARGEARLQRTVGELEAAGGHVVATAGDVANAADAERMVAAAVERFGGLDAVINNAGVSIRGQFRDLSAATCEAVVGANLLGTMLVSRAAVPHVVAAGGSLVFISSIAGLFGLPGASAYCAAKGGLNGLAESLRLELGPAGVHVGVVHLGFTEHDPEKRILAADGSGTLPDRPAHHTQDQAAAAILRLIEHRRRRAVLTPVGKLGAAAYRLSPRLVHWAIARAQRSQWQAFADFS